MVPPPLGAEAASFLSSNQGNALGKTAAEAGLLPASQSVSARLGRTNEPISFPDDQQTAGHYAQMARVLSRFNTAHEENWRLSELYGVEAKQAFVGALCQTLSALRQHSTTTHNTPQQHTRQIQQAKAEAQVLLCLRTCLRERSGAEATATTPQVLGLYVSSLQDHRPAQTSAGVPHMALRCLMNGSGQRPDVQDSLWQLQAPQAILDTLTKGGVLSCEGLCLGLRLLYHTCASCPVDMQGQGGFARLANSLEGQKGEGAWLQLLVPLLSWCVRCPSPPFPQGKGRGELGVMVLRCLFGVRSEGRGTEAPELPLMNQLGALLVEVLLLPCPPHPQAYTLKLEAIKLLLHSPPSFLGYVVQQGALGPLVDLLTWQAETVTIEKTASPSVDVCPLLALLTSVAEHSPRARQQLKQAIFPTLALHTPPPNMKDLTLTHAQGGVCGVQASGASMEPSDAPKHSLRHKLIRLMQVNDVTTQRLSAEFLFATCDKDADEFVVRTGFGSAAGLLQVKGLLDVPAS